MLGLNHSACVQAFGQRRCVRVMTAHTTIVARVIMCDTAGRVPACTFSSDDLHMHGRRVREAERVRWCCSLCVHACVVRLQCDC